MNIKEKYKFNKNKFNNDTNNSFWNILTGIMIIAFLLGLFLFLIN